MYFHRNFLFLFYSLFLVLFTEFIFSVWTCCSSQLWISAYIRLLLMEISTRTLPSHFWTCSHLNALSHVIHNTQKHLEAEECVSYGLGHPRDLDGWIVHAEAFLEFDHKCSSMWLQSHFYTCELLVNKFWFKMSKKCVFNYQQLTPAKWQVYWEGGVKERCDRFGVTLFTHYPFL